MPNWQERVVKRLLMGYGLRPNVNRPIVDLILKSIYQFIVMCSFKPNRNWDIYIDLSVIQMK
jgi:hypothetical protein